MKTKTKIVRAFLERSAPMTIKQISKEIQADYRITHTAVQQLLKRNVITITKVGNSSLCSLNRQLSADIFVAEEERRQQALQNQNIKKLWQDIQSDIGSCHFTLLLHGPYARRTATKFSEINLLFISNEPNFRKKVDTAMFGIPLRIEAAVVTEEEFNSTARSAQSNSIRTALQHNIILHGIESYYMMVHMLDDVIRI